MAKRGGKRSVKVLQKLFFTLLDSVILLSFSSSVYFTYMQDYTRTILFLALGCLLLMFFIVRGILKSTKDHFFD